MGNLTSAPLSKRALALLSAGHLVTDIYQGAIPALLPFLKASLGLSYTSTGAILLVSNIASSVVQPAFGYVSDRRAMAWLLPASLIASATGVSLLGLAPSYGAVLFLVLVSGLGIAAYHPEGYKTASYFTGERKATGMAYFSVGGNIGIALGPVIATYLVYYLGLVGVGAMIVFGLAMAGTLFANLPWLAAHRPQGAGPAPRGRAPGHARWRAPLLFLILAVIMRSWIQLGLVAFIPLYYVNELKGDPLQAGKLLFVLLGGGAIGTLLGAPIADRVGHRRYFALSLLAMTPLIALFLRSPGIWAFLVLALIGMILVSTFSVTVVMSQALVPDRVGMASGLIVGFAIGAGGIGVTLLGAVADQWGLPATMSVITLLPIAGFCLALLVPSAAGRRLPAAATRDHPAEATEVRS